MKLVINKCYGGFSLSPAGLMDYYARKGKKVFFYDHKRGPRGGMDMDTYVRIDEPEKHDSLYFMSFDRDLGDEFTRKDFPEDGSYLGARPDQRDDPDLVATVEALGGKADGNCAKLAVIEIPDDIKWELEEYDGIEWVSEVHRTWS